MSTLTLEAQKIYNRRKPLTFSREGNPYWPLPEDYPTLTLSGQKMARLNAVCNQSTPRNFVAAWHFFRTYYLKQLPPGVFYKRWKPSPKMHYEWLWDLATYPQNAWACPRASAKSTVLGKEVPLWLAATRQHFEILMVLSKDPFIVKRFGTFMAMFEQNPYILEDFGELRGRGSKAWNHHFLQLANGSAITGLPVEGKMLGERPDLILPDDPEHDKSMVQNPNPTALLEAFERLLFGTLFPMLEEGASIGWIGTLLSNRSFLYHVTQSPDKRFLYWNKRVVPIQTKEGELAWEAKWPPKVINLLRQKMGEEEFLRHFMNRPGVTGETLLKPDPDFCPYWVEEDEGAAPHEEPFKTNAMLVTNRPEKTAILGSFTPVETKRLYRDVVGKMFRIITVDYGYTTKQTSDFSCIHVLGIENSPEFKDTLYSLDMWLGKEPVGKLLNRIWRMAEKWKVHMIAPEAVTIQQALADQIMSHAEIASTDTWKPYVWPVKYKEKMDKGARIAGALEWRFDQKRVKLPYYRRHSWPYMEFFHQVEDFTQELTRLPHDDAIDTLAMVQEVVRPRGGYLNVGAGEEPKDPLSEMRRGNMFGPGGIAWITALKPEEIPVSELYWQAVQDHERAMRFEDGDGPTRWENS